MQTSTLPLQIDIKSEKKNDSLFIEISNTGKWFASKGKNPQSKGMKVGIENVKKRLEQFFPNRHRFQTSERNGHVHILLEIAA
jgi:LytS/YehU family sensor histidine kinase